MKRRTSELALVAVSLVCVLILAACNCAPTLRYITITPAGPTIVVGAGEAFTATGYYSNGAITPSISVSWSSSTTSVASINGTSGVATGLAPGTTTITATALGITSGKTTLTVVAPTSITVTPATAIISATGSTNMQQFDAVANYTGGSMDVTAFATWAATNTGVATFSTTTNGLATAVAAGTTPVTATLAGLVGTASLTVTNGTALLVTPAAPNLAVGNATALTVVEQLPGGGTQPLTGAVTWSSGTPAQANVVPYGTAGGAIVAGFAAGTPTITATEGALTGTASVTVDQGTAHYAYVADGSAPTGIDQYTVTAAASPYLAPIGQVATTGYSSSQVVLDPNGQYAYMIATSTNTTVTVFTVDATTGVLTNAGFTPTVVSGTVDKTFSLVDPYGRFLFVSDQNASTTGAIYAFDINQTNGALTAVTGSPFTANLNVPAGLAVDQSGSYLYASNSATTGTNANTIAGFQIDSTTGALTPLATPTVTNSLDSPYYMAWDPTGTYLYVPNNGNATVSSFTLGTGGALTALTTTAITGAKAPLNVAVSPNGSYLYVVDTGTSTGGAVWAYTLKSGSPGATAITGSPFTTGVSPKGIAIDPSSGLLAVDCANASGATTGSIYLYLIGSTGALTPATTTGFVSTTGDDPAFVTFYNTF
jgi:6-phosphogluconolactonase (cycloisomerase 2 family)